MKPQELNLNCEIFDDFREKFDLALNATMRNMIAKHMEAGSITAKIDIEMMEKVAEDGEVLFAPKIKPKVAIKIGAKGKIDCVEKEGFLMKTDGQNGFVIGTSQISMDELLEEQRGA